MSMNMQQPAYEESLRKEAKLLRNNIEWFKHCFDVEHMKDLSLAAKAHELPAWRRLNEQVAPLARRLCVIEWCLENTETRRLLPLHK
jgi:hypothetical protein